MSREVVRNKGPFESFALTAERWSDLEAVLGGNGDGGCWCMWWRLTDAEYQDQRGEANRLAMKGIVDSGRSPGAIAYVDGQPAGWCSMGPREDFGRLESSPLLKRVDKEPVWSIVCYYVKRQFRGRGLMESLTRAAVELAYSQGAKIVEAYPFEVSAGSSAPGAYTGIAAVLRKMGFVEVARPSQDRPIMRCYLNASKKSS